MALELARRGANVRLHHSIHHFNLTTDYCCQVVITYTSSSSGSIANDLASQIKSLPNAAHATTVRANMGDLTAPSAIVAASLEAFGPHIDILVNNAAVQTTRALQDVSAEDIQGVFDVNVRGVILLTQAVLKHLRRPGRVVNISSVGARQGFAELGLYCGSKAALEGLTRSWAGELGGVSILFFFLLLLRSSVLISARGADVGSGWDDG
jgi:3-oxoacyl-[acyl-carrier protein] reductase